MNQPLFSNQDMSDFAKRALDRMRDEVTVLSADALTNEDETVRRLLAKYQLEPVDLRVAEAKTVVSEDRAAGTVVSVSVPFSGSNVILKLRPNSAGGTPLVGFITGVSQFDEGTGVTVGTAVKLVYPGPEPVPDAQEVKAWRQEQLGTLEEWVGWANRGAEEFNNRVAEVASELVSQRKAVLDAQQRLRDELDD